MRPVRSTPAHQTSDFAELVCSNSLKSESVNTAPWLLKEEMRRAGSLLLELARECAVPAGHALAVDRAAFAARVTEVISREPLISVRREEVTRVDEDAITIVASGPLTSDGLSAEIARLCGGIHNSPDGSGGPDPSNIPDAAGTRAGVPAPHEHRLFFFDSISPIVEADSIDMNRVYLAARYDKGTADYINCPFTKEEYDIFYDALIAAQSVEQRDWEKLNYFEGCLPIEEIARRGRDTLRFGPMKPVGLRDPRTGKQAYAVVQLRQENLRADSYNLVGFQNHLKYGEQARVLRLIPGLENAKIFALRADSSQYLHQCAHAADGHFADAAASTSLVCGTDLRSRGLCGVDCHRPLGGASRYSDRRRSGAGGASAGDGVGIVDELHHAGGSEKISAGEYYV